MSFNEFLHISQDLQTIKLDEFKYGGTNITAFRLVDPDSKMVQNAVRDWSSYESKTNKKTDDLLQVRQNNTNTND